MPWKPQSHSQRQARTQADVSYTRTVRQVTPALAEAQRLRNTARWHRVRAWVLMQEPLCRDPYGLHAAAHQRVLATQVDHVLSLEMRPDLAYEVHNLQPLCTGCHARKSAAERQGKGARVAGQGDCVSASKG